MVPVSTGFFAWYKDKKDKRSYQKIRKLEKQTKRSNGQIIGVQEWENTENEREGIIKEIIQEKFLELKDVELWIDRIPQMLSKIDLHLWKDNFF